MSTLKPRPGVLPPRSLLRGLGFLLAILLLPGCGDEDDPVAPDTRLRIGLAPTEISAATGEIVEIAVEVDHVDRLFGAQLRLIHPQELVVPDSRIVERGSLLREEALLLAIREPGAVVVGVSEIQTPDRDGVSGSGTLVVIRLRALAAGHGELRLSRVEMIDDDGQPLRGLEDLAVQHATITVR